MKSNWSKGRGKLGIFKPLMGHFRCEADTEIGQLTCERQFQTTLDGKYVTLDAVWTFQSPKQYNYSEHCLFGVSKNGLVSFWSFTSDGKQSQGWLSEAPDVHEQSICFEADMDAGRARQIYWPSEEKQGFQWAVESRTKQGWNRFLKHHYRSL